MIGFSSQLGKAILGRMQLGNLALGAGDVTTTQTITGVARITGTTTRTITGVSRISAVGTQTIDGTYLIATLAPNPCQPITVVKVVPSGFDIEPDDEDSTVLVFNLEPCERKGS